MLQTRLKKKRMFLSLSLGFLVLVPMLMPPTLSIHRTLDQEDPLFDKAAVWSLLQNYAAFSPITPGSSNHEAFIQYATAFFKNYSWTTTEQQWCHTTPIVNLTNLIAIKRGANANLTAPIILLGAHYDARIYADKDPDLLKRTSPVPGINDGGSGVAVLLELARVLTIPSEYEVWVVFFDAEDQGGISGWAGGLSGWCIGSSYFANSLNASITERLKLAIIIDLVGSPNLRLTYEDSSNTIVASSIWHIGQELGFNTTFLEQTGTTIIDDHKPFLDIGIPAVDIIQLYDTEGYTFFKWHHTTNDTIENTNPESLYRVGATLEAYLEEPTNITIPDDNSFPYNDILVTLLAVSLSGLGVYAIIKIKRVWKPKLGTSH